MGSNEHRMYLHPPSSFILLKPPTTCPQRLGLFRCWRWVGIAASMALQKFHGSKWTENQKSETRKRPKATAFLVNSTQYRSDLAWKLRVIWRMLIKVVIGHLSQPPWAPELLEGPPFSAKMLQSCNSLPAKCLPYVVVYCRDKSDFQQECPKINPAKTGTNTTPNSSAIEDLANASRLVFSLCLFGT